MYQDYFGFSEMPFHVTPNPRFLFLSPTHQEALQHLRYGIENKKGFIVLTGEVGCGKTTLCRQLLEELEANERYETALLLNPKLRRRLKGLIMVCLRRHPRVLYLCLKYPSVVKFHFSRSRSKLEIVQASLQRSI